MIMVKAKDVLIEKAHYLVDPAPGYSHRLIPVKQSRRRSDATHQPDHFHAAEAAVAEEASVPLTSFTSGLWQHPQGQCAPAVHAD